MADWRMGMIDYVVIVLAIQPMMGALHGDDHVTRRYVLYGDVQQLRMRVCSG
jgi:hypothetical protein